MKDNREKIVREVVDQQMMLMLARKMNFAPSPEDIAYTARIMAQDLLDSRVEFMFIDISVAFQRWAQSNSVWPTPADIIGILKNMVAREKIERESRLALPPPANHDVGQKALANMKRLLKSSQDKPGEDHDAHVRARAATKYLATTIGTMPDSLGGTTILPIGGQ